MLARINEFLIGYNKTKTQWKKKRKTLFDQKKEYYGRLWSLKSNLLLKKKKMGGKKWIYVEISDEIILKRKKEK